MKIVNIIGGLGNQMFQYAFAYALHKQQKVLVKLDTQGFDAYDLREYELDAFNVSLQVASRVEVEHVKYAPENIIIKMIRKILKRNRPFSQAYYKEDHFQFDEKALLLREKNYYDGYWQSEVYFKNFREEILSEFTPKNALHPQSKLYKEAINSCPSVSLHIRRGDYVTNAHANTVHGTASLAYYQRAVKHIQDKIKTPHFFIFSDDMAWAKENLSFIETKTFIELDKTIPDYEEMILMSQCQHNIIANSSFSWWGAWLNRNDEKIVIAPQKWFNDSSIDTKDLIPEEWVKL